MDVFGIEIRDDSLILAHLKTSLFGLNLKGCEVFSGQTMAERLCGVKDYIFSNAGKSRSICVVLPRGAVVSGTIEVPAPERAAIKKMLDFEMDKHLPFRPAEAYWDFDVIERKENLFQVLFAAVRRDTLDGIMGEFRGAGLEPSSATFWQASIDNALFHEKGSGKVGLVAVAGFGPGRVTLDIFSGSVPVYSKSAGAGRLKDEERAGALAKEFAAFSCSGRYLSPGKRFEGRVVTPDTTGTGLKELESLLGVPVTLFRLSGFENAPSSSAAAIGAALAAAGKGRVNIDLLRSSGGKRAGSALKRAIALSTAAAGLLFLTGATYIVKDRLMLDRLDSLLEEARTGKGKVQGVADSISASSARLETLEEMKGVSAPGALEVLRELALMLPQGTWLTDFEYKEGVVSIEGYSDRASAELLGMESSGLIKDAEFAGPVTVGRGKEHFRIKFRAAAPGEMEKNSKAAER
ncbi:MAG: hypothetical protein A2052_03890 [Deltaproteobacteria bacterium GWA2_54_12]|nr:MAG: hypothetical protein A2052_03890 [Deltaproteobacteria bacterium GWA2_54_12]